jgi:hypothetical protein
MLSYDRNEEESWSNGNLRSKTYFLEDLLHRLDGPALILYYESGPLQSEHYFLNGSLHRDEGPATIMYSTEGIAVGEEYWYNGSQIRINSFVSRLQKSKDKNEVLAEIVEELTESYNIVPNHITILINMFREHLNEKLVKSIESALALC